jgi:hypothetical protein
MNTILYVAIDTVGLPAGHLGAGNPDALYIGSRIRGHRIADFLPRLTEMKAIEICQDQNLPELILASPGSVGMPIAEAGSPVGASQPSGGTSGGVATMTAAELRAKAESLGIAVPTRANKAEIQLLIDEHVRNAEKAANEDDEEPTGTTNGAN